MSDHVGSVCVIVLEHKPELELCVYWLTPGGKIGTARQ